MTISVMGHIGFGPTAMRMSPSQLATDVMEPGTKGHHLKRTKASYANIAGAKVSINSRSHSANSISDGYGTRNSPSPPALTLSQSA